MRWGRGERGPCLALPLPVLVLLLLMVVDVVCNSVSIDYASTCPDFYLFIPGANVKLFEVEGKKLHLESGADITCDGHNGRESEVCVHVCSLSEEQPVYVFIPNGTILINESYTEINSEDNESEGGEEEEEGEEESIEWPHSLSIESNEVQCGTINFMTSVLSLSAGEYLSIVPENTEEMLTTSVSTLQLSGFVDPLVNIENIEIDVIELDGFMTLTLNNVSVNKVSGNYIISNISIYGSSIMTISIYNMGMFSMTRTFVIDLTIKGKNEEVYVDLSEVNTDLFGSTILIPSLQVETESGDVTVILPYDIINTRGYILYASTIEGNINTDSSFLPTLLRTQNLEIRVSMPQVYTTDSFTFVNLVTVSGDIIISKGSPGAMADGTDRDFYATSLNGLDKVDVNSEFLYFVSPISASSYSVSLHHIYYNYEIRLWDKDETHNNDAYIFLGAYPYTTEKVYPEKMEARWDITCGDFGSTYTCKPPDSIYGTGGNYPINYNTKAVILGRGSIISEFNFSSKQIYINLYSVECESINVSIAEKYRKNVNDYNNQNVILDSKRDIKSIIGIISNVRSNKLSVFSSTDNIIEFMNNRVQDTFFDVANINLSYSTSEPYDFYGKLSINETCTNKVFDSSGPEDPWSAFYNIPTDVWIGIKDPEQNTIVEDEGYLINSTSCGYYSFGSKNEYILDSSNCDSVLITSSSTDSEINFVDEFYDENLTRKVLEKLENESQPEEYFAFFLKVDEFGDTEFEVVVQNRQCSLYFLDNTYITIYYHNSKNPNSSESKNGPGKTNSDNGLHKKYGKLAREKENNKVYYYQRREKELFSDDYSSEVDFKKYYNSWNGYNGKWERFTSKEIDYDISVENENMESTKQFNETINHDLEPEARDDHTQRLLMIFLPGYQSVLNIDLDPNTELFFDNVKFDIGILQANVYNIYNSIITSSSLNINCIINPIQLTIKSNIVSIGIDLNYWDGNLDVSTNLTCSSDCYAILFGNYTENMQTSLMFSSQVKSFEGYINGDEGSIIVRNSKLSMLYLYERDVEDKSWLTIISLISPIVIMFLSIGLSFLLAKIKCIRKRYVPVDASGEKTPLDVSSDSSILIKSPLEFGSRGVDYKTPKERETRGLGKNYFGTDYSKYYNSRKNQNLEYNENYIDYYSYSDEDFYSSGFSNVINLQDKTSIYDYDERGRNDKKTAYNKKNSLDVVNTKSTKRSHDTKHIVTNHGTKKDSDMVKGLRDQYYKKFNNRNTGI